LRVKPSRQTHTISLDNGVLLEVEQDVGGAWHWVRWYRWEQSEGQRNRVELKYPAGGVGPENASEAWLAGAGRLNCVPEDYRRCAPRPVP